MARGGGLKGYERRSKGKIKSNINSGNRMGKCVVDIGKLLGFNFLNYFSLLMIRLTVLYDVKGKPR